MAWYACSSFALITAVIALLYWSLIRDFEADDDQELQERLEPVRSLLQQPNKYAELRWEVESEGEGFDEPHMYLRILDKRGKRYLETHGMSRFVPSGIFPAPVGPDSPLRGVRVTTRSGRPFRVMAAEAKGSRPGEYWIVQAAFDLRNEMVILRTYKYLIMGVLAACALISLGIGYRIAQSGLRPLNEIVETTRRIRSGASNQRVAHSHLPRELAILADNFNAMLDRLDESFGRLSRFSADIAHELRTPLNVLRGQTEVALGKPRSVAEYCEVLASNLEEYVHMSRIVDTLLFIAQAETSKAQINLEAVEVTAELRDVVGYYEAVAAEKGIALDATLNEELLADVDRDLFRRAVGNLVSNALAHTPAGGTISVAAVRQDAAIRVEVNDNGSGIAAEHLPHVFDRFYRAERDRRRESGHVGLGLSIVKTVVELHNGSAQIASELGAGTRVTLTFPEITKS